MKEVLPKIAIFDLTDCEGCELEFLALQERLLELFQNFEVTSWRLIGQESVDKIDLALVEGAVTTKKEIELLKKIRRSSKYVVAFGECAACGYFPKGEIPKKERSRLVKYVYGQNYKPLSFDSQPIEKFIKIDGRIRGCPVNPKDLENHLYKFLQILKPQKGAAVKKKAPVSDLTLRIEGHGKLQVDFSQNKAKFQIEQGERLIEGLLLGKPFQIAPYITSRICGICPTVHNLTSIAAIENGLRIKVSAETILLRKLMLCAQIIQSHLIHLFFLVLPDFANVKSSLQLAQKYPAEFHLVLNLKRICDKILTIVAGRPIHPTNTTLGGFLKVPKKEELLSLREDLFRVIDEAQDLVKIFQNLKYPNLQVKTEYLCLKKDNEYSVYDGDIFSNLGKSFKTEDFQNQIKEEIIPGSSAKYGQREKDGFLVGAIARVSINQELLEPKAKEALKQSRIFFPSYNTFHQNLAQSIEILHFIEESIKIISQLQNLNLTNAQAQKISHNPAKTTWGIAAMEAPRGTLYHAYEINPKGLISNCDILTPTVQNLSHIAEDASTLLKTTSQTEQKSRQKLLEMLVRAYDPCITCSVH